MTGIPFIILFFWAGFVCSISFMESWLKFRADGVTRLAGLSIGSKIFTALNRVEAFLFVLFVSLFFISSGWYSNLVVVLTFLISGILVFQTFFLLPSLRERAQRIIRGIPLEKSNIHRYYIIAEVLKVVLLFTTGYLIFIHIVN